MAFFRFQDLRVYQKTMEFVTWASRIAEGHFANGQGQIISNKLVDASLAIATSIAEGSAAPKPIFVEHLKEAKASVRECVVLTELMLSLKLLNERNYEYTYSMLSDIIRMLGGLITSLSKEDIEASKNDPVNGQDNENNIDIKL